MYLSLLSAMINNRYKYAMNKILKLLFLFSIFLTYQVFSQDVTEVAEHQEQLTRSQILDNSVDNMSFTPFTGKQELEDISSWLANAPSLQLSIMNSHKSLGSDEFETSINLPIKSNQHRRLDKAMLVSSKQMNRTNLALQKLMLSGLIRESVWDYVLAIKKEEIEQKKKLWLEQQRENIVELINVGDMTAESLLFLDKRLLDSNLIILELKNEAAIKLSQYQKITGSKQLPSDKVEESIKGFKQLINQHPKIEALKIALEQSNLNYEQSGSSSSVWNVALTTRDVKNIDFDDKQLGFQIEVPLSFSNKKSQANKTVWLKEQMELSNQLQSFYIALSSQYEALKTANKFLLKKQKLLQEQAQLTKKIVSKLKLLRSNNELEQDVFYQRMIELQTSIYEKEINQVYIYQNLSRQNQLAGVSL